MRKAIIITYYVCWSVIGIYFWPILFSEAKYHTAVSAFSNAQSYHTNEKTFDLSKAENKSVNTEGIMFVRNLTNIETLALLSVCSGLLAGNLLWLETSLRKPDRGFSTYVIFIPFFSVLAGLIAFLLMYFFAIIFCKQVIQLLWPYIFFPVVGSIVSKMITDRALGRLV